MIEQLKRMAKLELDNIINEDHSFVWCVIFALVVGIIVWSVTMAVVKP